MTERNAFSYTERFQTVNASLSEPRVVVITGGSSGIGRCTAALFARHGWRVGLIAREFEGLAASRRDVELAGARGCTAQADVTDNEALIAAAQAIAAELGPIDVWINCAGNGVYGRFGDVPEVEFQRVTDVTYHGTVNGTRVALAQTARADREASSMCGSAIAFHGSASDVVIYRAKGGGARVRPGGAGRTEARAQPDPDHHGVSAGGEHALFQSCHQPYGLACAPGLARLSA